MALLSLAEAKADLGLLDTDRDTEVTTKLEMASDIVVDYISEAYLPETPWTDSTAPDRVKAAAMLVLRNLFYDENANPLTEGVTAVLRRLRDPTLA